MDTAYDDDHAGVRERVRALRLLAGLSQNDLAAAAGLSASLVSQVERGVTPASPAFIASVARALGRSPADLQAEPLTLDQPDRARVHAVIGPLRRELASHRLPPTTDPGPVDLDALTARVRAAARLRHAADLTSLGAELPAVLYDLRAATHTVTGSVRPRVFGLLAEAYAAAGQVAYKLGYSDLSALTTDRVEWAAERSHDPGQQAAAAFYRAGELIAGADWTAALGYLERARHDIEADLDEHRAPELVAMWGQLHLKSGLAAARAGDPTTADAHLQEARETALRIRDGRDDYRLAFGASSVDIWSVGLATEAMDGPKAIARAQNMTPPTHAPRERVGHHWIDTSRAFLLSGDRDKALAALQTARHITPQQARHHPQVAETIRALVEGERRRSGTVTELAAWAGVI